ncbi:tripartite tricarboxylate transporter TctB family protein [Virgibacillus proomii]|uniref:tripartite tricarboxylate transporter TctB family protein n=1 Tax=Virgibacillus proomii TaxID=84407 RepID=UPI001C116921|nr:tripartite tricarboxylate transporter TctB family protein [Virgibacillus proomii]MBU5266842.1 tripartite tricarboxylate transporter TctB family protein [Virgibacillus proomii]
MLKSAERKISIILTLLAIGYLILSYQLPSYPFVPVDSDLMPKLLGFLLIVLSIILFFGPNTDEQENKTNHVSRHELVILLLLTALIILYISLLEVIGFVIVTALFIFSCSWILGYKNFKVNVIVSILFPVVIFYIFNYLLQINLPSGILPF